MYQKILSLKWLVVTIVVIVLALFPSAAGAAESTSRQPVGEQINILLGSPTTFPAGQPFHIRHGHSLWSDMPAIGVYDFKLQVDGTYVREDYVSLAVTSGDPDAIIKTWVFNFPDGMSGTHTFVGHWLAPCRATLGPCQHPNAQVEFLARTLTVTFGP